MARVQLRGARVLVVWFGPIVATPGLLFMLLGHDVGGLFVVGGCACQVVATVWEVLRRRQSGRC